MMSRWCKNINMLADAFKLAHHCLLKGLVYNDEHEIAVFNQTIDTSKDIGRSNNSKQLYKSILQMTHKIVRIVELAGSVRSLAI